MKKYDIEEMRRLRLEGRTLEYIGKKSSLTRERVRQVLAENYGEALSSARGVVEYIRNEICDYEWDAGDAAKYSLVIAKRILMTLNGKPRIKVKKDDPLLILFK